MIHAFVNSEIAKPTPWWHICHDVDLLRGVYKYGYSNWHLVKEDHKMSWYYDTDRAWPQPDRITVRLKRVVAEW
jgi:hypothetical protein